MSQNDPKPWETTASEYVVNDRWLKVRADTVVTAGGHELSPYYVMEYEDWGACMVISDSGELTLLRHYRYAVNRTVLEVVGGRFDNENENPEEAMKRELQEELGLVGAEVHKTGACYTNPATHTNQLHCFIAIGGTFDGEKYDEPGADFRVIKMPLAEHLQIIEEQSEVMQSLHLSTIMFALNYLRKHRPELLPPGA